MPFGQTFFIHSNFTQSAQLLTLFPLAPHAILDAATGAEPRRWVGFPPRFDSPQTHNPHSLLHIARPPWVRFLIFFSSLDIHRNLQYADHRLRYDPRRKAP